MRAAMDALHSSILSRGERAGDIQAAGRTAIETWQFEQAEASFREAIALASSMRSKAWELRATMSLASLLASQGRRDEACAMLAEIYNWFTEGFDTADLKEAKALLAELNY